MRTLLPIKRAAIAFATAAFVVLSPHANAQSGAGRVVISPSSGFSIQWDHNNGNYFKVRPGGEPPPNDALASRGAVSIGSSELNLGVLFIHNINDGLYGNSHSWISSGGLGGNSDPNPWVGVVFAAPVPVRSVAWGRDNGDDVLEQHYTDRSVGTYTVQITRVSNPGTTTAETGDAATGWQSIGMVQYLPGSDTLDFSAYLRHEFSVSEGGAPAIASALRIKVSDPGIEIDELEVNPRPCQARSRLRQPRDFL